MKCPYCNEKHPNSYTFCPNTGKSLGHKTCSNPVCVQKGKQLSSDYSYCPCCGAELTVMMTGSESPTDSFNGYECETPNNLHNGHEYVDLGLPSGTLWATCNIGANDPLEFGDYFAWGETIGSKDKVIFSEGNYKWGTMFEITKYCLDSMWGKRDGKRKMDLKDDAAHFHWGGQWHIPSKEQFEELIRETKTKLFRESGIHIRKVISKRNGNFIYLPAAGNQTDFTDCWAGVVGHYWSSSICGDEVDCSYDAYEVSFGKTDLELFWSQRYYGQSIRPVYNPKSIHPLFQRLRRLLKK